QHRQRADRGQQIGADGREERLRDSAERGKGIHQQGRGGRCSRPERRGATIPAVAAAPPMKLDTDRILSLSAIVVRIGSLFIIIYQTLFDEVPRPWLAGWVCRRPARRPRCSRLATPPSSASVG